MKLILILFCLISVQGFAEVKMLPSTRVPEKSLYDRIGGEKAITAIVDDFVARASSDPKVNFYRDGKYKKVDVSSLKKHMAQFLSMATGGPSHYDGHDMKTTHAGMKIKESEFDAVANDVSETLDRLKIPAKEKNEFLTIVNGTKGAIVEL